MIDESAALHTSDPALRTRRVRTFYRVTIGATLLAGVLNGIQGQLFPLFATIGMAAALGIGYLVFVRPGRSSMVAANYSIAVCVTGLLVIAVEHGTSVSGAIFFLPCCVLFAAYLTTPRLTTMWTAIALVALWTGVALEAAGISVRKMDLPQNLVDAPFDASVILIITWGFGHAAIKATNRAFAEKNAVLTHLESLVAERTADLSKVLSDTRRSAEARSRFLETMSHELRIPLHAILGLGELLAGDGLTEEQGRHIAEQAEAASDLLSVVDAVLDFTRLEAGEIQVVPVEFDPVLVMERVVSAHIGPAFAKQVDMVVSAATDVPATVRGDAVLWGQAIAALVDNAVAYTVEGAVTVALTRSEEGLCVTVSDTGCGLDDEQLDSIRKPFARGRDISGSRHGFGNGLAAVARTSALIGGSLEIDSEPGAGSIFTLTTPLETVTEAVHSSVPRRAAVVTEDDTARDCMEAALTAVGADVVRDPAEADVVVFDAFTAELPVTTGRIVEVMPPGFESMTPGAEAYPKPLLRSDAAALLYGRHNVPADRLVIVADDNPLNARILAEMVTLMGFEPVVCGDGQEAADAYAAHPDRFAAVLTDSQMPLLDGYGATRRIRELERTLGLPAVPIVAVTGDAFEADRERCLAAGMDDHLAKPVRRDDLAYSLSRWLEITPVEKVDA